MRSEYLKYVVDTAEQGSIALAAKKNFISPQGLGRAIAVVEDELGFEIFHRTANSLSLTPKGKRIFPAISRAVQSMSMLHAEALKLLDDERSAGSIVFCSSIVFMSGMISRLYSDFADTSFNLRYVQLSTERIIEAFCNEENTYGDLGSSVGIALFFNPGSDASQAAITRLLAHGGEYRPYIEYEDGVLLPESSPLATKEKITHADLEDIKGLTPVYERLGVNLRYNYYVGMFSSYDDALEELNVVRLLGFPKARITAWQDGRAVPARL